MVLDSYRFAKLFPDYIHESIKVEARDQFVRGKYDTAIFLAFKQVEIAVKEASGLDLIGVALMRAAFAADKGPLTDNELPAAERDAIAHLFAGSIGYAKNPGSHRKVLINDPHVTIELLMLASHLLRLVDSRLKTEES